MPIINKGTSFSNGEQLTADKLNNLVDQSSFNASATDGSTTFVNSSGQIAVADSGISAGKLATNAVETAKIKNANVTFAKLADVLDEDDMSSDSATSLATQQSIKAYVDTTAAPTVGFTPTSYTGGETTTFPNGLIIKFGQVTLSASASAVTFGTAFPNACISVQGTRIGADEQSNMGITAFSTTQINCNPLFLGDYTWLAIGH